MYAQVLSKATLGRSFRRRGQGSQTHSLLGGARQWVGGRLLKPGMDLGRGWQQPTTRTRARAVYVPPTGAALEGGFLIQSEKRSGVDSTLVDNRGKLMWKRLTIFLYVLIPFLDIAIEISNSHTLLSK